MWAISLMLLVLLVVAYYGFVLFEYDNVVDNNAARVGDVFTTIQF